MFAIDSLTSVETAPFEVVLNKSGKTIAVGKDESIIDALLLHNVKVEYTCLQGTCGSCVATVLDGAVDHRDAVLSEAEKGVGRQMCLCVSRAKNDKIVLDL